MGGVVLLLDKIISSPRSCTYRLSVVQGCRVGVSSGLEKHMASLGRKWIHLRETRHPQNDQPKDTVIALKTLKTLKTGSIHFLGYYLMDGLLTVLDPFVLEGFVFVLVNLRSRSEKFLHMGD